VCEIPYYNEAMQSLNSDSPTVTIYEEAISVNTVIFIFFCSFIVKEQSHKIVICLQISITHSWSLVYKCYIPEMVESDFAHAVNFRLFLFSFCLALLLHTPSRDTVH
jgi:hypothetical protein